jgi:hypothetical protein
MIAQTTRIEQDNARFARIRRQSVILNGPITTAGSWGCVPDPDRTLSV